MTQDEIDTRAATSDGLLARVIRAEAMVARLRQDRLELRDALLVASRSGTPGHYQRQAAWLAMRAKWDALLARTADEVET